MLLAALQVSQAQRPLRWLDFGSGQERGIRGEAREAYMAKQKEQRENNEAAEEPADEPVGATAATTAGKEE